MMTVTFLCYVGMVNIVFKLSDKTIVPLNCCELFVTRIVYILAFKYLVLPFS